MHQSFEKFMRGIIDYAGLFPPSKLPMDEAIQNYACFRKEADHWMLSRFICPAARLTELAQYKETLFGEGESFRFSALGRSGKSDEEFFAGLKADLQAIAEFREFHGGSVIVDAFEVRLPGNLLIAPSSAIRRFLDHVAVQIEADGPPELHPFFEPVLEENWRVVIDSVAAAIAAHNEGLAHHWRYQPAGFKLRCGGVEPHMYPSPEQVAFTIAAGRGQHMPLKATAGLHHPVRHYNETEQVKMHGFLNVFGAGILAEFYDLNTEQIQEIIEDENPDHFQFSEAAFAWKDLTVSPAQIEAGRTQRVLSFGSCSFDEPREDLQVLNLL